MLMKYYEIKIPRYNAHSLLVDEQDSDDLLKGNYAGFIFPIVYITERCCSVSVRELPEMLYLFDSGELLISNKMIGLIDGINATGWKSYHMELYDSHEDYISGYSGFSICSNSMKDSFDFVLECKNGSYHYYCSDRIRQMIEKRKFKGFSFKEVDENDTK